MKEHETDIAIIGAGPVGLFTVFEAGMLKLKCHVIDALHFTGGQCMALYPEKPIFDIPAWPEIRGDALVQKLEEQAAPFAPVYHLGQQVVKLERDARSTRGEGANAGFILTTSTGTVIHAGAVIIAAGCGAFGPNRPPLEGLEAYEVTGGVRYMVGRRDELRDKHIVVAGGGDSAVDWALSLYEIAASLTVVHRRNKFRCAAHNADRLNTLAQGGLLDLAVPYQLAGLEGTDGMLQGVVVKDLDGHTKTVRADVLLPFYGLAMELGPIAKWGLNLDKQHIAVDPATLQTSEPGIFAIGDIATYLGKLKLILCGFSEAAMACYAARAYLYPDHEFHFEYSTTQGVPA